MRLGGLDSYEIQRSEACARYGESSATNEKKLQQDMDIIVGSHMRTAADVALMKRCYDLDVLDASFECVSAGLNPSTSGRWPCLHPLLAALARVRLSREPSG